MVTMTDLFSGAGGSTTGATQVPGVHVTTAINHWPVAIATHQLNHPDTDHRCADISQLHPSAIPATDIIWSSSECTFFSQAATHRDTPAAARSRSTAFDIIRFAEHRVDHGNPAQILIQENVPEWATWRLFRTWRTMLEQLGYQLRLIHLNSAAANIAGNSAPQYRDRLYIIAWHDTIASEPDLDFWLTPRVTCPTCGPSHGKQTYRRPEHQWTYRGIRGISAGRYRAQYDYRCLTCNHLAHPDAPTAAHAVNETDPGQLVTTRAFAPATITRIRAGIKKFANTPPDPDGHVRFMMRNNGSKGTGAEHCTPIHEPLRTLTTAGHQSIVTFTPATTALRTTSTRFITPSEAAAGMGFPTNYHFTGNQRDKYTQAGNAVTPPVARDLISCAADAIEGTHTRREAAAALSTPHP